MNLLLQDDAAVVFENELGYFSSFQFKMATSCGDKV